jgi:anti-anti-sigma regulatory factor
VELVENGGYRPRLSLTLNDSFNRNDNPTLADSSGLRQQRQTFTSNTFGASLDWLIDAQTSPEGHLSTVGNEWWPRGGDMSHFDQQPIEATALLLAAEAAFDESGDEGEGDPNSVRRRSVPPGVEVYEINGPFFFGAAEKFKETMTQLRGRPRVLILRLRNVPAVDSTGLHALRDVVPRFRRAGTRVILSDVHAQPMVALQRSALGDELADEDLVGNVDDALNLARVHLGLAPVTAPTFAIPTVAREDRRRHPR